MQKSIMQIIKLIPTENRKTYHKHKKKENQDVLRTNFRKSRLPERV